MISSSAKLDYQLGYMVVRRRDVVKIHISEIEILLVESTAVSLTAVLLSELTKKKIKVIFCDEKRNPSSELIPYYGCYDVSAKLRAQLRWEEKSKTEVWTVIVKEKIRKQAEYLEQLGCEEAQKLYQYIEEIKPGDVTNREGHAAKVYFNAVFGMDFTRTAENSINAALNYGYGILLSAFNREIVANGFLTQLGLFHDNTFNPFNFASDLMEPFRPLVDSIVQKLKPTLFEHEEKMVMLGVMQLEVIIGGRKEFVNNAIKIYSHSVFDALIERDASLIKSYQYEL